MALRPVSSEGKDMYYINRRPLAYSIAATVLGFSVTTAALGRELVGPGTSYTINPGDPADIW